MPKKKLYLYTLLNQDGTKQVLEPSPQKDFKELYKLLNCSMIEVIPNTYYEHWGDCTVYSDEEARFKSTNIRNPFFKVFKGSLHGDEWDVVGNCIKEEVYHAPTTEQVMARG